MNSKFEKRLQILNSSNGVPRELINAMIYVHDGLEVSQMIAESIFGNHATHEDVLNIYDRVNAKHNLLEAIAATKQHLDDEDF